MERGARQVERRRSERRGQEPAVVVPLDGTRASLAALPVAKEFAELEGATVHVIHVAERALPPRDLLEKLGLSAEHIEGSVINGRAGAPATEILRVAHERKGSLVVLCPKTGAHDRVLGSIALDVLKGTHVPVVLVNPERRLEPYRLRKILFPHDGTPTTAAAIGPVLELAERAGAELVVFHVAGAGAAPDEAGTLATPFYVDQPQHEWPAWTREFLDRLCGAAGASRRRAGMRLGLGCGDPALEIARVAAEQQADIIAVGWRGSLAQERAKIARSLIARAPCPILVLRVGADSGAT